MPRDLSDALAGALGVEVDELVDVRGGDVNDAARARLADGRLVFVKSSPRAPEGSFRSEADGLAWLAEPGVVRIPAVLACADDRDATIRFLALEWIESGAPAPDFDPRLGRELAALHRAGAATFGAATDGFLAGLPQLNDECNSWAEFYVTRRLEPMLRRAVDSGRLPRGVVARFERLFARVEGLVGDPEPPARLHGDLWSGNVLTTSERVPCLVDPAPYGGHREVDLAMMRCFGGFADTTFAAYHDTFPLADGWAERVPLYQVWPLLVHVVLFGSGYSDRLERAVARYA